VAVWGKGQARVAGAIHGIRQRFTCAHAGFDSGNESEFINEASTNTASNTTSPSPDHGPIRKMTLHIEQKNWVWLEE